MTDDQDRTGTPGEERRSRRRRFLVLSLVALVYFTLAERSSTLRPTEGL